MTRRRALALVTALVGLAVAASIPALLRDELRARSADALGAVANGTVVAVEREGEGFTLIVELADAAGVTHRLRVLAETTGALAPRPRQQVGDPVLVAYDPSDLSRARLVSVRTLWRSIVSRGLAALAFLVMAVGLWRDAGKGRGTPIRSAA